MVNKLYLHVDNFPVGAEFLEHQLSLEENEVKAFNFQRLKKIIILRWKFLNISESFILACSKTYKNIAEHSRILELSTIHWKYSPVLCGGV